VERFLSTPDQSLSEHTLVSASAERTYAALDDADVSGDRVLGVLSGLPDLADRLAGSDVRPRRLKELLSPELGFVPLADEPRAGRTLGLVARYNAFERGVAHVEPQQFATFAEPGYVKVAIAFTLLPQGGDRTVLGCEIDVAATDDDTRSTLESTWFLVGPALGLLARRLLEVVRSRAEGAEDGDGDRDQDEARRLPAG
jgi:hypothetical protein